MTEVDRSGMLAFEHSLVDSFAYMLAWLFTVGLGKHTYHFGCEVSL
jgi:hypothetical protein